MSGLLKRLHLYSEDRIYIAAVLIFLVALGSHILDDRAYIFVLFSLLLVDWRNLQYKTILLPVAFLVSVLIAWIAIDHRVFTQFNFGMNVISRLILIGLMYLLGYSIVSYLYRTKKDDDIYLWFYVLSVFFITYTGMILISYFYLKQDNPLNTYGMHVIFPNEYKRLNVNNGRLISTIIAYYLAIMIALFTFVVIFIDKLKKKLFSIWELILFIGIGLSALYFSVEMGRRVTIVVLLLNLLLLIFVRAREKFNSVNKAAVLLGVFALILFYIYTFGHPSESNYSISRLWHLNPLDDQRFTWWATGIKAMLDFPLGGGHGVMVAHNTKLAHNTWIDIGKDFGVIPFSLFLLLTIQSIYFLIKIALFSKMDIFKKVLLIITPMSAFPILMIEPVFTSDKTFIAYLFFYMGIVSKVYNVTFKNIIDK